MPGHPMATSGHWKARQAAQMRTPRVNPAARPPWVTAKEDFHVTQQMPRKARVGRRCQGWGGVWPRNSLAVLGTCPRRTPAVTLQGPPGLPGTPKGAAVFAALQLGPPPWLAFPSTPQPTIPP